MNALKIRNSTRHAPPIAEFMVWHVERIMHKYYQVFARA
jgi:hypothetical protein